MMPQKQVFFSSQIFSTQIFRFIFRCTHLPKKTTYLSFNYVNSRKSATADDSAVGFMLQIARSDGARFFSFFWFNGAYKTVPNRDDCSLSSTSFRSVKKTVLKKTHRNSTKLSASAQECHLYLYTISMVPTMSQAVERFENLAFRWKRAFLATPLVQEICCGTIPIPSQL